MIRWKFNADDLSGRDIESIASIIRATWRYGRVIGIPRGGLRLAAALLPYERPGYPLLIVDDVLTTGASMVEARAANERRCEGIIGIVIVARGPCPDWVYPILTINEWAR